MRSSAALPGNPWPRDMMITVDNDLQPLLELLWIREAWQLAPEGDDLPPTLVDTPALVDESQRSAAPIPEWRTAWPSIWGAALRHAGTTQHPEILDRLHGSEISSDERARLLRDLVGPSWRDELGPEAITEEAQPWMHTLFLQRVERPRRVALPEHAALDALIQAWRSGLTKIVEIPCEGDFTRVIGTHAILVTAESRADPERYRAALAQFH